MAFQVPERFRVRTGDYRSSETNGNNGAFVVTLKKGTRVFVVASDGLGWEHVSVSRRDRTPTWDEMCQIKNLFWSPGDCVVQFHPPAEDYINQDAFCLHLWRQVGADFPRPPKILVGI